MSKNKLAIIGAPTSAGAYAPGQEKTPDALRAAGLVSLLEEQGIVVSDKKNVNGFRWKVDKENKRAMNVEKVEAVAKEVAVKVTDSLREKNKLLVIGGDCTVELGVVAGCLELSEKIGLIYIDLDTDLNTPQSVEDGALDWMGVAHLLAIEGTVDSLASIGNKKPMLRPEQVYFFANGNVNDFERKIISASQLREMPLQQAATDPSGTARKIIDTWAGSFDHLLIHMDLDVLDYTDIQLAENYRRNTGLTFDQLMTALHVFLKAPNWSVLTITEINPDHGEEDGSTLRFFAEQLAKVMGRSMQ